MTIPLWLYELGMGVMLGVALIFPAWVAGKYARRRLLLRFGVLKSGTVTGRRMVMAGVEFDRCYLTVRTDDGYQGVVTFLCDLGIDIPPEVGERVDVLSSRRDPRVMLVPLYEVSHRAWQRSLQRRNRPARGEEPRRGRDRDDDERGVIGFGSDTTAFMMQAPPRLTPAQSDD